MNVRTVNYTDSNAAHEFTRSLRQTGFSVLTHHPVPIELVDQVYAEWADFFSSESKINYLFDPDKQDGFFPIGSESAKGYSTKDLKEFYHIYPWGRYPNEISGATSELYGHLVELTSVLLGWIQDETPDHVKSLFSIPLPEMIKRSKTNLLRILHYPPLDGGEEPEAIRGAAHEDINLITLLVAGTQPGLQVQDLNNKWHDVPCDHGSLAINGGDMLQEASSGYFPSTTHQVINPGDGIQNESRYSMPLFLHPRDEVVLSDRYTAREYLDERLVEIGLRS